MSGRRGAPIRARAAAGAAFAAVLGYAALRYAVLAHHPLASVPLWVVNKAIAVLAVGLVAAASLSPRATWRGWARSAGFAAALAHAAAAVAMLRPSLYASMFEPVAPWRPTAAGAVALGCGALALAVLVALRGGVLARGSGSRTAARAAAAAGVLAAAHCAALHLPRWLDPGGWPGGLPPMSLIGAGLALLPAVLALGRAPAERAGVRRLAAEPHAGR